MKRIIYILVFICSVFIVNGQSNPSGFPTQLSTGWFRQGWHQSDSGEIIAPRIPNFTPRFPGTTILYQQNGVDTSLHYWTGGRWVKINAAGTDTTSLSNRINLKLNITDTANKWWGVGKRWSDTLYRVNDSTVGYTINGDAHTFQILGRLPSGGGSGTVTSVGLSLPSAFNVTPSTITTSGTFAVSGAGTTAQYIRGNGTLATTDTGMIPNFHLKVRSLITGSSPITFNQTTGIIGINNANTSGTKGAASFSSAFTDDGSGGIDLLTLGAAGSCTGCTLNIDAKGRVTGYSDGAGGATDNINIGSGFRPVNVLTQEMRTYFAGFGSRLDTVANVNGITWSADTTRSTGLPTYFYVDSIGGGGAVLNNIGAGFAWAATPGGNIKRVANGYGIGWDSTSTANTLTAKVDTSIISTKYYVKSREQSFLGTIYNQNQWSSLTDFTQTGGIVAAPSANKIAISGGAGSFSKTLDINWYSMLERWKITCRFKVTSAAGGTTYGIGIGMHSTNTYGSVNALGRIDLTNTGTGGKVILNGHTDNRQMAISSTALPFSLNDTIELRVERKVDSIIVIAINRTQSNATVRAAFQYNLTNGVPQLPNTGRFSIFAFGGTQAIDSISVSSEEIKNAVALTNGDSKTQGYYAQSFSNRYTSLFNSKVPATVLHAGGYDRTTEWLTYLPEIKELAPHQVLLTNPSNDLRSGMSSATSQAQYGQIVDSLESWGIDVFHGLAFYETAQDNSAWNTFIAATYSSDKIIDFWNPTKNCVGCIDVDGIHLTGLGNDTVYNTQLWSFRLKGGNNNTASDGISFSGTDNTLAMFSAGTIVDSYVYQDANRAYVSKGFETTSTDPGFDIYKTDAGTDEKGWNIYSDATNMYIATFNDARNAVYNAMKFNRTGNAVNYIAVPQPFVVGQSTNPGTYMQSVVTTTAPILRLRTTNANGGYIGLENGGAVKGYIGYGSVLTTGASNDDVTVRSQSDVIHFSNNAGTQMVKIDAGKLYVTSHTVAGNADSAVIWDRSTKEYKVALINGSSATTLYTGDGTLPGNRTVTGGGNSLTFTGLFNFRVNANTFILDKSTPAAPYTAAVLGADNTYWLGYTPTPTVYSKGAGIIIDTNNNVSLGTAQIPTTAPLYTAGSAFTDGLQNQAGYFSLVSAITSNITATIAQHYFRIDATSGNITITLPAASTAFGASMGIEYEFKRIDNSGNTITIQRAGSDLIDGGTSFTLGAQWEFKKLKASSSSTWDLN